MEAEELTNVSVATVVEPLGAILLLSVCVVQTLGALLLLLYALVEAD